MNKRTILILALVAVFLLPTAALAKAEFSLGGYIKLDFFWDSSQEGKNMNGSIARNNTANWHHGRVKVTSQSSRFNFTIKGPKLWGATTTGFIEIDMDAAEEGIAGAALTASNSYSLRLRHAMFKFNWPETELLFGQYWSMLCEFWPELAQDGPFQRTGQPTARLPQVRFTQKFLGAWMASILIGEPNRIAGGENYPGNDRGGGESAESPQVQARVRFTKDLWGKAAYMGKPTPFIAQVALGWQRNPVPEQNWAFGVAGQNNYGAWVGRTHHQYVDPWVVEGTLYIPVIATHSANLAGTASILTQWYIGQGVEAFGWAGQASNMFRYAGLDAAGTSWWDFELQSRFGGFVQAQYYFTNQWFLSAAYAMSRAFNTNFYNTDAQATIDLVTNGRNTAIAADTPLYHHEFAICLWYRPITAFKFGLQYAYQRTNWIQRTPDALGNHPTDFGDAHRVQFVGLFYF